MGECLVKTRCSVNREGHLEGGGGGRSGAGRQGHSGLVAFPPPKRSVMAPWWSGCIGRGSLLGVCQARRAGLPVWVAVQVSLGSLSSQDRQRGWTWAGCPQGSTGLGLLPGRSHPPPLAVPRAGAVTVAVALRAKWGCVRALAWGLGGRLLGCGQRSTEHQKAASPGSSPLPRRRELWGICGQPQLRDLSAVWQGHSGQPGAACHRVA